MSNKVTFKDFVGQRGLSELPSANGLRGICYELYLLDINQCDFYFDHRWVRFRRDIDTDYTPSNYKGRYEE